MTTNQIRLWQSAAEAFDTRHTQVLPEHHALPTPCDQFDVEALVGHVVGNQARFAQFFGSQAIEDPTWPLARVAMSDALASPTALEGDIDHPRFGQTPKERLLAIVTNDMLIHSWDLSRALGIDETLPDFNLESAIEGVAAFSAEVRPALFGKALDVGAEVTAQERLLAIAGRQQ